MNDIVRMKQTAVGKEVFGKKGEESMILLDFRDKRPIYEQVVEKLERLIVNGALEANSKMPSVRSMGIELAVNPNTIQRAYNQLEQEGYLYTVSGRGSFVAPESEWRDSKKQKMLEEWELVTERAKESGLTLAELTEELHQIFANEKSQAGTSHSGTENEAQKSDGRQGGKILQRKEDWHD